MSADGPPIDERLARRLIDTQFPEWAGLPIAPVAVSGWDNRTFRLGEELSVRLPSAAGYALQVEKEQRWLPVLAPRLPLPIPEPVARGAPGEGYPHAWSVYRWLEGEPAGIAPVRDQRELATDLAGFLVALAAIDPDGGPAPGPHNFQRGGPLTVYEDETLAAIAALGGAVDGRAAWRVWDAAVAATWAGPPVWFHGDVAENNLLIRDGRLAAVIDFGTSGVGDPACDAVIAWTYLDPPGRAAFRAALGADDATWERGRGWALWKALITLAGDGASAPGARRTLDALLAGS